MVEAERWWCRTLVMVRPRVRSRHAVILRRSSCSPNPEQISSQRPSQLSPWAAAAQGDASLLLFPSTTGSGYWESPWLGLSPADPWQSVTQWQLVRSLRHSHNILMLAAGKVKEVSTRGRETMGQQQRHPLANPPAGEKQTGFAIAKGW